MSTELPPPAELPTEHRTAAVANGGLNSRFNLVVHCLAAEPTVRES